MRYRAEKTTKQIENEELSRLTEASTQGGEGRPTTQLDPDALRALLGTDEMQPVKPPQVAHVVAPSPTVEPSVVVDSGRSRWPVLALCVVLAVAAAFATRSFL